MGLLDNATSLLLRIRGDSSHAVSEIKKLKKEAGDIKPNLDGLEKALSGLAAPAAIAAAGVAALGAGALAVTAKLFSLSKQAAEYGSAIFDAAQKTGASTDSLQALKVAAEQSGSSFEAVTNAVAKFNVLIGNAAAGNEKAEAILAKYGVTSKDTDTALVQAISTLAKMTSSTEQAAAAGALFKDRTGEILPVIKSFDGDLPGLINKLHSLGLIMSKDAVNASDEFGDQLDTLNLQLAAVGRTIGIEVMPAFQNMAREVSAWLAANRGEVTNWANGILTAFDVIRQGATNLKINLESLDDFLTTFFSGGTWQDYFDKQAGRQEGRVFSAEQLGFAKEQAAFEREMQRYRDEMARLKRITTGTLSGVSGDADAKKKAATGDTRTDRQVYNDFVAELKKLGVTINSGFRTFAQQSALFAKLPRGQAARPGTSDHEFFRAVDLPAGVSDELVEQAARAARVVLSKKLVHQGTGLHRHQAFRKGLATGGGEEEIAEEFEKAQKEQEKKDKDAAKVAIDLERETMAERLEIFESGQKLMAATAEQYATEMGLTARQLAELQEQLDAETLEERKRLLEEYIAVLREAGPEGVEELRKAEHRLKLLEDDIEINRAKNAKNNEERNKKELEDREKIVKSWNDYVEKLYEATEAEDKLQQQRAEAEAEAQEREDERRFSGLGGGLGGGLLSGLGLSIEELVEPVSIMQQMGEILANTFQQVANAVGEAVKAFVLFGGTGGSIRKFVAEVIASVAQMAAVEAVWNLAKGFAMLALNFFWPDPRYAAAAAMHFKAAAVFGGIAAVAAVAGRAVAGDSFQKQTAGGGATAATGGRSTRDTSGQGGAFSSLEPYTQDESRNAPLGVAVQIEFKDKPAWFTQMFIAEWRANGRIRRLVEDGR